MTAQEKPRLKIGGALRFNYNYSDWKPESRNRGGEFDFDVLRLNVNASYKKIDLAVDYRFYPSSSGGGMLREGWIGYRFNDSHRLQIGLTTVPFGVLPYTGNNYFFNLNYYAGLEDDADMGIKYLFHKDRWAIRRRIRAISGWYIISETCGDINSEVRFLWEVCIIWTHERQDSVPLLPCTT